MLISVFLMRFDASLDRTDLPGARRDCRGCCCFDREHLHWGGRPRRARRSAFFSSRRWRRSSRRSCRSSGVSWPGRPGGLSASASGSLALSDDGREPLAPASFRFGVSPAPGRGGGGVRSSSGRGNGGNTSRRRRTLAGSTRPAAKDAVQAAGADVQHRFQQVRPHVLETVLDGLGVEPRFLERP